MSFAFDLSSYQDVSAHADAILQRLLGGTMPCDGAWPPAQVELFRRWIEAGKQPWLVRHTGYNQASNANVWEAK